VIHAVGPVWRCGDSDEPALLAACYRGALQLADSHGLRSVAFPCISTGVYGYPLERAAHVAIATVTDELVALPSIERVVFCCFGDDARETYERLLGKSAR